jgi:GTP-binding protein EngB required for normal cell division
MTTLSSMTEPAQSLRDYVLAKQRTVEVVRALQQVLQEAGRTESDEQCRAMLVDLAEDRFNLAVVGQFKRGKSSLMNAIIGRDLLPTGLLPLTSAITTLRYGPQEKVVLRREGWVLEPEVPLAELADYVTERGNPGNEKGLIEARVELPISFLRRGLHFVDTPGIGSSHLENTATTYEFLPKADALIFVTSVEAPLSEAEEAFLRDVRGYVRRLFVVVNKTDLLATAERAEVLNYVREGLEQVLAAGPVRIHPLSARQALAARLAQDEAGLRESGLLDFETDLSAFLSDEKEQAFLVAVLDRADRLLQNETGSAARGGLLASQVGQLEELGQALETLRAGLLRGDKGLAHAEPPSNGAVGPQPKLAELLASKKVMPLARKAGETGVCPICEALGQTVFDFFVRLQSTLVTSAEARRSFADTHGLCCVHTWQFQQIASPQAVSDGYAPLLEHTAAALGQAPEGASADLAAWLDGLLASRDTCPACAALHEAETEQVGRWLAGVAGAAERDVTRRARALCLPHTRAVLAAQPEAAVARRLLEAQAQRLEEIAEDMRSYGLKRAALRSGLNNTDEERAWVRAMLRMAGQRTACS